MSTLTLRGVTFETTRSDLQPLPIEPSWIKSGTPVARSVTLGRSPDSLLTVGLWDCTAGTFTWIFRRDEIVHIVEGEVRVRDGAATHVLVPGSVAYFPCGLETTWEVPVYVKKAFVLRAAPPSPVKQAIAALRGRASRFVRSLKGGLAARPAS
jgi:uncharacterized cupin superfamily protein